MAARIAFAVLVLVGPQDLEDDADFGDIGPFQALQLGALLGDEFFKVVVEQHDDIPFLIHEPPADGLA